MKEPIFVLGNPRSGTTLLRLILTSHSSICIPPECGWMIGLYPKYQSLAFNKALIPEFLLDLTDTNTKKFETWRFSKEFLEQKLNKFLSKERSYSSVIDFLYRLYSQTFQKEKQRWGDKNNFFLYHIPSLNILFPNAKFIHIVRDGRDVACSYRDMKQFESLKYGPKLPSTIIDIAHRWQNNLDIIQSELGRIDYRRSHIVRYEDLVQDTTQEIKKICSFIGEQFEDLMVNFYQSDLEPIETIQWKSLVKEPISVKRIGRWKNELTQSEQKLFNFFAKEKLIRYGYLDQ